MAEEYSTLLKSRDGESKSKKKLERNERKRKTEKTNTAVFRCNTSRKKKIFECNQKRERERRKK
jgi:hypothetical protein